MENVLPISRREELLQRAEEMDELDITIFVPCRNEEKNIERSLNEIIVALASYSYSYEIIVIDDASSDASVSLIERFIAAHPEQPITLKRNLKPFGVSYNLMDAAILGRGKYFRTICGHFQDRRGAIKSAFDHLGKADIIITYMDPDYRRPLRQWTSRTYTKLVNFISGYKIVHYHGTPIHRRIDILRWHSYRSSGFYADLTTRLLDQGVTYLEVPTSAFERDTGKSLALRWRNVISLLIGFAGMLFRRFTKNRTPSMRVISKDNMNAE